MIKFENSWHGEFSQDFYQKINPHFFPKAQLIYFNNDLAKILGLDLSKISQQQIFDIFSGSKIDPTSKPIALAYAGHQFGNFVAQLGDGRAILLGEIINNHKQHFDIQLKGSGKTRFSRNGDGFATLASALRELIIGEALNYLEIPATRILSICLTNSPVYREEIMLGAVMARVADSYLRIGSFEYFACRGDKINLKKLCNYALKRHFSLDEQDLDPTLVLFENVVKSQAKLIAKWQAFGFIHGVMNTDNMSICGQSIDFGPCAFLDEYNINKVFSAIDYNGRYRFGNQPKIAKWNLWILLNCLAQITDKHQNLLAIHEKFEDEFEKNYYQIMAQKLGFIKLVPKQLIDNFLVILQKYSCDYTQSFRHLSVNLVDESQFVINNDEYQKWFKQWRDELKIEGGEIDDIVDKMNQINPAVIARNHRVEEVIEAGNNLDFAPLNKFLEALKKPFDDNLQNSCYSIPPTENQKVRRTFCGT